MSNFAVGAMAQDLKETMRLSDGWSNLSPDVREALDQIQSAVAEVLAGRRDDAMIIDLCAHVRGLFAIWTEV